MRVSGEGYSSVRKDTNLTAQGPGTTQHRTGSNAAAQLTDRVWEGKEGVLNLQP
jgi:hypothetical protein